MLILKKNGCRRSHFYSLVALCSVAVGTKDLQIVVGGVSAFAPGRDVVGMTLLILNRLPALGAHPAAFRILPPLIPFREFADIQHPLASPKHKLVDTLLIGDVFINLQFSNAGLQGGGVIAGLAVLIEQDSPRDPLHQPFAVIGEGGVHPIDDGTEV